MAAQQWTSTEQSNAQRVILTKVYEAYQNKTDILGWFDALPNDQINKKGLQVPIELSPNPSLAIGTGDGDAFATAQAPNLTNFVVSYVNLNAGTNETYAALINNNVETSEDMFRFVMRSDAAQFASFLNSYVSNGAGTAGLAIISSNYSGGSATTAVCNGSADSIGNSQLVVGGYYKFYDTTGATQRTGTVGASAIQLSSKTTANAVFATDIPSDVVATDIIVPELGTSDATSAPVGLPYIIDNSTTYFGLSRSTYPGLQSYEKTSAGSLTAGMLAETWTSVVQRGGYFDGQGNTNLDNAVWMVVNAGNLNAYYALTLSSGAIVGSPHTFRHTADERPAGDLGMSSFNMTYFGAPIKVGNRVRGDEWYFLNRKCVRKAILKPVGGIINGMPQSEYLSALNSDGAYLQARLQFRDWWGQFYSPEPFKMGKISGITLTSPTQKATQLYG